MGMVGLMLRLRQFMAARALRLFLLAGSAFFAWHTPWLMLLLVGLLFGLRASAYAATIALIVAAGFFARYQLTPATESWSLAATYLFILTLFLNIAAQMIPDTILQRLTHVRRQADLGFAQTLAQTGRFIVRQVSASCRLLARGWRLTAQAPPLFQTRRFWTIATLATTLALFFVPFGWFDTGEADYGGDSSRLYFLDPVMWLKTRALFSIDVLGFGFESPVFSMIPWLLFLQMVKIFLFNNTSILLAIFNGLLLATAFLSTYAIIRDLHDDDPDSSAVQAAAYLGGLFFVLAPLLMFSWMRALFRFHEIALYPLLMWLLLRFVQKRSYASLLFGVFLTGAFALNFGFHAAPSVFAAWPFLGVILLVYAIVHQRLGYFVRGLLVFLALFLALHAFHILPQIMAFTNTNSSFYESVFTSAGKTGRGLNYFEGVRPMVRLVYNLARLPQYFLYTQTVTSQELLHLLTRYALPLLPILLLFPVIMLVALFRSASDPQRPRRSLFLTTSVLFMISLFLMTANMFGEWGPRFYASLFAIPGFAMFRSFYGVFSFIFVFLYALGVGLGLRYCFLHIRNSLVQIGIVGLLVLPLTYPAVPFVRGDVVNVSMNDTRDVSVAHRFSPDFTTTLAWVEQLGLDAKFLTFPLTQYDYHVIAGERGGAYVGPSPLTLWAGKSVFSGLTAFDAPDSALFNQGFFLDRLFAYDVVTINRLLSLMNVDFIFYNRSPDVYRDKFIGWPYSQDIWSLFPESHDFVRFSEHLGYRPVYERGPYVVYQYADFFLPRLSTPRTVVKRGDPNEFKDYIISKEGYDIRTAFYRLPTSQNQVVASIPDEIKNVPAIEFRQFSPIKYRVRIHGLRDSVPLIFSQLWHPGWQLIPVPASSPHCDGQANAPAEQPGGISAELVNAHCSAGTLSTIGPHYISQPFNGTIQNNNLPAGKLWEAWRRPALDEKYHVRVNEYANSWWLDVDHLRQQYPALIKDSDQGLEAEFVLEFTPQRSFYLGSAISLAALLGIGGALAYQFIKRKHSHPPV